MALRQAMDWSPIMESTVTLLVTRGPLAGKKFAFSNPSTCTIGRSRDCTIALPLEVEHLDVSRHHCLLDISPPAVRIRDLGSLNGTYLNDKKIGQRMQPWNETVKEGDALPFVTLIDGDEIRLGEHTAFRICVFSPGDGEISAQKPRRSSGELRFQAPVPS
jgi:eukaryotic-like serine/threonine-protein kinase